jgi:hypothetical protein
MHHHQNYLSGDGSICEARTKAPTHTHQELMPEKKQRVEEEELLLKDAEAII